MRQDLETAHAQRDAALIALQLLERIMTRVGGYMEPAEQDALWRARAVLAEHGRYRGDDAPVRVDRVPWNVVGK